jgi:hypothetical protein
MWTLRSYGGRIECKIIATDAIVNAGVRIEFFWV